MTIFAIAHILKFENLRYILVFRTYIKKRPEKLISGIFNVKKDLKYLFFSTLIVFI